MLHGNNQIPCQKIISGGQTGVDRGALDACLDEIFMCGGWCPKGRKAEDGPISDKYPLNETDESDYETRTKKNIEDSDGTLILHPGGFGGGTMLTSKYAKELKKPLLLIDFHSTNTPDVLPRITTWISKNSISVLNVAGPRHSEWENGYRVARQLISALIYQIKKSCANIGT